MQALSFTIAIWLLATGSVSAETIRWGFSPSDPAPYVVMQGNELGPSITRSLGERVASRLDMQIDFVEVPNNRIDRALRGGRIDLTCNTLPAWHKTPEVLRWSKPLYRDADVLVSRTKQHPLARLADLRGMRVGTAHDQHHTHELAQAFRDGTLQRLNVRDAPTRLRMVEHDRLDASVERRYAVEYYLRHNPESPLTMSSWTFAELPMRCAAEQNHRTTGRRSVRVLNGLAGKHWMREMFADFGITMRD